MTNNEHGDGSGFICTENDDVTAENLAKLLDQVGLSPADCVGWNAYPWYINKDPKVDQLEAGVEVLAELLALLKRLEVVVLFGGAARDSWRRLGKHRPALVTRYQVFATRHTSSQAFIGTGDQKQRWKARQVATFREAATIIRGGNQS